VLAQNQRRSLRILARLVHESALQRQSPIEFDLAQKKRAQQRAALRRGCQQWDALAHGRIISGLLALCNGAKMQSDDLAFCRRKDMRKKIAVGIGLVLLAITLAWWLQPSWPPLRVGMEREEVDKLLGDGRSPGNIDFADEGYYLTYIIEPDVLGNRCVVGVLYSKNEKVVSWEVFPLPWRPPPWFDRTMKAIGW
jgi:hypothetical protein